MQRTIQWTPRILCLLFAALISLFALDVFDGSHGFWPTALALIMHLIPTAILLVVLAVAWRWEWVGAVVFPGLGLLYIGMAWGRFPWSVYALITGPLVLLGILFWAAWRLKKPAAATGSC
jgi:hypothetical protein